MNATAVASSNQMFSSFGQPSQPSATPVNNPFASKPTTNASNPFGFGGASSSAAPQTANLDNPFAKPSDGDNKPSSLSPFGSNATTQPTLGKPSNTIAGGGSISNSTNQNSNPWGQTAPKKPQGFGGPSSNGTFPPSKANASLGSGGDGFDPQKSSNDPHAIKVYSQIRKDGLSPPAWPSQPGDPKNKAQMAKFREQYEEYRSKVRASLTKAGLIDDPTKRRALQDAIDFRGICEDMCPEFEKITRITEFDVPHPEKDPNTSLPDTKRMVKKLARSAAGQEAPLPMDVLSIPTLKRTLNYLINDLLQNDSNLPTLHGFLWDRTRAIRRDFSFFSSLGSEDIKTQAYVLENIARFHVTALHLLSKEGQAPEDFVEQQELEQLGKALLSLRDIYDDCNAQGIDCENEAEFRAYYLLFHAHDPNILEIVQRQWRASLWKNSDDIRTAVSLVEALQNTQDFHGPLKEGPSLAASSAHQSYFRIVEDKKVSYTMACFAECHFPQLRRSMLRNVKRALSRPKESSNDVTAATLNRFLRFDTIEEAIEFAELHGLEFSQSQGGFSNAGQRHLILNNRQALPHHRLQHQFSQTLVERKRCGRPLPDLIHTTVYEDAKSTQRADSPHKLSNEGSLFVESSGDVPSSTPSPFGTTQSNSPFAPPPAQKPLNPAAPTFGFSAPKEPTQPTQSIQPTQPTQAPATNNPFASTTIGSQKPVFGGQQKLPKTASTSPFQSIGATPPSLPESKPAEVKTDAAKPFSFLSGATETAAPAETKPFAPTESAPPSAPSVIASKPASTPFANLVPPSQPSAYGAQTASSQQAPVLGCSAAVQHLHPPMPKPPALPSTGASPFQASTTTTTNVATPAPPPFAPVPAVKEPSFTPTSSVASELTPSSSASPFAAGAGVTQSAPPKSQPVQPPVAPKDLMKNFAKWFVQGDNGLLEDFKTYFLEDTLKKVFLDWETAEEERKLQEEEDRDAKTADSFRHRVLSVRYFYRWKTAARERRLKFLRRQEREKLRQFHKAQQAASLKSEQEAARRSVIGQSPVDKQHRQEELLQGLKQSRSQKRTASDSFRASSSIVGPRSDHDSLAAAVGRHFKLPGMPGSPMSTPNRSRSSSITKGGAKTRALREELLGGKQSGFRRSFGGSVASSDRSSPESVGRVSNASERWRLKAMGIVQLPDGTAVPETLLKSQRQGSVSGYAGRRSVSVASTSSRRGSFTESARPTFAIPSIEDRPMSSMGAIGSSNNKRKRQTNDSIAIEQEDDRSSSHKRVMSDAENLIQELRAMREEMEEGTLWFKQQNGRLHSEAGSSRGGTPFDGI